MFEIHLGYLWGMDRARRGYGWDKVGIMLGQGWDSSNGIAREHICDTID